MGKNMKRLLLFAIEYPGWHTYGKDRGTVAAIRSLSDNGFIETNDHRQFRLADGEEMRRLKADNADMSQSVQAQFTRCPKCKRLHDSGWVCVHCRRAEPEVIRPRIATDGQREFGGSG